VSGYYYLMAQLPVINPAAPVAFSYAKFSELAHRFLSSRDARVLDALSLEPARREAATGSTVVDAWYRWERALRLSLARFRAAKLGRNIPYTFEEEELVSRAPDARAAAHAASSIENPLEAELALDRARLARVESLRGGHFFDSEAVFLYGLTLLLRERRDRFSAEAGRASYTTIYSQILGEQA